MPTSLALLLALAGLAIVLVIIPALAMSGHLSDLERQAEIDSALWRAHNIEDQETDPPPC
jgi:hypothetical protein